MTEKIINRIRSLLAKAESTTPGEAELLNAKAEELLLRHELSMAQIRADHTRPERYVALTFSFDGAYALAKRRLVCATGDALNGFPVFWGSKRGQDVNVYVWESSAEHVWTIINSLLVQAETAREVWWASARYLFESYETTRQRAVFLEGFGYGAAHRIRETVQKIDTETTGAELVLVSRKSELTDNVKADLGQLRRASRSRASGGALNSGFKAGNQADVGTASLERG